MAKFWAYSAVLAAALVFVAAMRATDTLGEWQAEAVKSTTILGRTVIRYEHDCLRQGKIIASGTIRPDVAGLLTVPRVAISREPVELVLDGKQGE